MPTPPQTTKHVDPRTAQFIELLIAIGLLTAVHLTSYVLVARTHYAEAYVTWALLGPLGLAITGAAVLLITKRWHWGQAVYFVVIALVLSLLQLLAMAGD
ncbi:hypothetical protein [Prosthecobacter sp.]|uniref:hypothetical protein n=1 Tax=Prosthecobacter sp. TaxID=1965333 RepID=UPI00378367BF